MFQRRCTRNIFETTDFARMLGFWAFSSQSSDMGCCS
jgi:hypothetical protein